MGGALPGLRPLKPITLISSLPGVAAHATYIGLYGSAGGARPGGRRLPDNSVNGSLDGEYFSQDRVTVLAGLLPPQASTTTVILTPAIAKTFGTGVGGTVSYQFQSVNAQGQPTGRRSPGPTGWRPSCRSRPRWSTTPTTRRGALPAGATRQLLPEYYYAWIGLRLARGTAAIPICSGGCPRWPRTCSGGTEAVTHQDVIAPRSASTAPTSSTTRSSRPSRRRRSR